MSAPHARRLTPGQAKGALEAGGLAPCTRPWAASGAVNLRGGRRGCTGTETGTNWR